MSITKSNKILYISSNLPFDVPYAGNKTSHKILSHLSENYVIDSIIFYNKIESKYLNQFKKFIKSKGIKLVSFRYVSNNLRIIKFIILFWLPLLFSIRINLLVILKFLFSKKKYDFVYSEWSQSFILSILRSKLLKVKLILSLQDVLIQSFYRKYKIEDSYIKKTFYYLEYIKLIYWEPKILRCADHIIVQSQKDKDIIFNYLKSQFPPISVITPYISSSLHFSPSTHSNQFNVILWGAVDRVENVQAIKHYLLNIHPIVRKKIQTYKFYIVGANPPQEIFDMSSDDVIVTGFVDDPSTIFNNSHLSVVPLLTGAGIKVKTLESLLMGLPTVSTEIGAEGINIEEEYGLYVRNHVNEFVDTIFSVYERYLDNTISKVNIRNNLTKSYDFSKSLEIISSIISKV